MLQENWLTSDVQDRRYITVVDEVDSPHDNQSHKSGSAIDKFEAAKLLPFAPLAVPLLLTPIGPLALLAFAASRLKNLAGDAVKILPVPRSLAAGVDFGPNGWEPNVVYAANPKQPTMYRSLASFHEELLLHKISELDRLLNALGALEYSIEHVEKRGKGVGGAIDLGVAGAGAWSSDIELTERKWSGTSDCNSPRLPDRLVWFDGEPEWQNLAESRFNGTRRKFAFSVRQAQDFGVDANVAASVEALKFEIGGRFKSVKHVEFAVTGTF